MKNSKPIFSFSLLLSLLFVLVSVVLGQSKMVNRTIDGKPSAFKYTEISYATEPCEPVVCEWWNKIRQAGNELLRKGDGKSKQAFALLFLEGLEKSYRIPLKDQKAKTLSIKKADISDLTGVMRSVKVVLNIEFRFDGSIGDIKVVEKGTTKIEDRFINASRENIFLPAIKDGAFVTSWDKAELNYISTGRSWW